MSKPTKKKVGHRWKKGQSGNPKGRKHIPNDVKEIKSVNNILVTRILNKYSTMTVAELEDMLKDRDTPVLESLVARVLASGLATGCDKKLEVILTRLVGRPVEKVEIVTPEPYLLQDEHGKTIRELGMAVKKNKVIDV